MARRSRSATPTPAPTRQTRSNRAASSEPAFSPKRTRSRRGTSAEPSKAPARTHSRQNSTSNSKPASHQPKAQLPTPPTSHEITRNAFGECRFATEDVMMQNHAQCLLEAGVIDADQAARLAVPWHEKGVLNGRIWDEKYLDASRKADLEIMSLEKAKKIQARKDAKMKKWLENWEAGRIDEDGKPIVQDVVVSDETEVENEDEGDGGLTTDETESEVEVVQTKKKPPIGRALLAQKTQLTPIAEEKSSIMASPLPAPVNLIPRPPPTPQKSTISRPIGIPGTPSEAMPDYKGFSYYQLVALCRKRGLSSGGKTDKVRARLMADDVAVRDGTARKDLATYSISEKKREYKTEAPEVHVPTKRKRGGMEEDDKEKGGKRQKARG